MKYLKAISLTLRLAFTRAGWDYLDGTKEKYGFIGFAAAWKVAGIIHLEK